MSKEKINAIFRKGSKILAIYANFPFKLLLSFEALNQVFGCYASLTNIVWCAWMDYRYGMREPGKDFLNTPNIRRGLGLSMFLEVTRPCLLAEAMTVR